MSKHRKPAPLRRPVKKVSAAAAAGAAVTVLVYVLGLFGV